MMYRVLQAVQLFGSESCTRGSFGFNNLPSHVCAVTTGIFWFLLSGQCPLKEKFTLDAKDFKLYEEIVE
uniref:Uncharacterized protein n=1 Tax=Helianthus annuus TaxID=4232 RepID=A0A251TIV0_HELAN